MTKYDPYQRKTGGNILRYETYLKTRNITEKIVEHSTSSRYDGGRRGHEIGAGVRGAGWSEKAGGDGPE